MDMEEHVAKRYSQGAEQVEPSLCCPVSYPAELLAMLPQEIIDKDYGCGNPSLYVQPGDTVLDLGSGGGKVCYMAAQLVGTGGRVIGVDMNDDMLALSRKYQGEIAAKLGEDRVVFHKGRIQDLALSLDKVEEYLRHQPVSTLDQLNEFLAWQRDMRQNAPMIADNSVDLVISNCVLNLVNEEEKRQLVQEIYRVVKPGGRIAISDIVCDELPPEALKKDPHLWSGCISGAFQEREMITAFAQVGFSAVAFSEWQAAPWQVVEGIEFRSVTLTAVKHPRHQESDRGHAVIYRGPFAVVEDEQGRRFPAGERVAVSTESFRQLGDGAYGDAFIRLTPPRLASPTPFDLPSGSRRPATVTRGGHTALVIGKTSCC
ncbi:MAG: methyltransferase domain-containing protein [Magnetococcales bacterium]|nr:methyltransferase domain-containing protein [Magnetococcales bacterium]NGZ25336.1 methyltransferase domain-containing protein [Magnetococcales bacterium]